jgi:hypothetical protein
MIRHVAVFTFVPEFSESDRDAWIELVKDLPRHIPEVRAISIGKDVLHGPVSHDIAIVADFDDLAGLETYSKHPAHEKVLEISGPVKASIAVVDFEI